MGDKFIRQIIKHFKNNKNLSYGEQQSIKQTLKEKINNPSDIIEPETPPQVDINASNLSVATDIPLLISYLKQVQIGGTHFLWQNLKAYNTLLKFCKRNIDYLIENGQQTPGQIKRLQKLSPHNNL